MLSCLFTIACLLSIYRLFVCANQKLDSDHFYIIGQYESGRFFLLIRLSKIKNRKKWLTVLISFSLDLPQTRTQKLHPLWPMFRSALKYFYTMKPIVCSLQNLKREQQEKERDRDRGWVSYTHPNTHQIRLEKWLRKKNLSLPTSVLNPKIQVTKRPSLFLFYFILNRILFSLCVKVGVTHRADFNMQINNSALCRWRFRVQWCATRFNDP